MSLIFGIGNGQINMNSDFGRCIYNIAKDEKIQNILEVGSWNGQGSTVCIMNAIINKPHSKLYSLEANLDMFNIANAFWNKNINGNLILLNGSLHNKIADITKLNIIYNNNIPYYNEHYIIEKKILENTKIIDISDINNIDMIILDGGEYTTEGDFDVLIKKKPKYICLDDVNVYKCKNIRQLLLNDSNWKLYNENLNQRHGWSIFISTNIV
jgi:hypothetical protein